MKRRSKTQWLELFAEHEKSGQSVAAFCHEREVNPNYFSLRRKQLQGNPLDSTARSFVPVALTGQSNMMMIELHLNGALQLRVPASVSPHWLAELVQHLRA